MFSLAPRDEAHAPWLDIAPRRDRASRSSTSAQRTGIVTRNDAYLSPLAARAIELIELGFADHAREEPARRTRVRRSPAR